MTVDFQGSLLDLADEDVAEARPGPLSGTVRRAPLTDGRVGGRPAGVAGRGGGPVRPAGGRGAVAGGEAADVRPGGRRAAAAVLLRRGRGAARPGAGVLPVGAERVLRAGAG